MIDSKLFSKFERLNPARFYVAVDSHNVNPKLIRKILGGVELLACHVISILYYTLQSNYFGG